MDKVTNTLSELQDSDTYTMNQKKFYSSEQYTEARAALEQLVDNPRFDTDTNVSKLIALPFVERHLHYLSTHPQVKVAGYIANLKIMTSLNRKNR
jgi:predicted AlkP superfamily phosphohydrolase/phosphomutase